MLSSRVFVQVDIAASPEVVFDFVIDLDRHRLWNAGLMGTSKTGRLKLGMAYTQSSNLMGRKFQGHNTVTEFVSGQRIGIENRSGPLQYNITYSVEELAPSLTRLTCQCDIGGQMSFFNLATPLLEYLAQSRLDADLHTLKLLIEHGSPV